MQRVGLVLSILISAFIATAAWGDDSFSFRLSPGPRLVGTRADRSGSGRVSAKLSGNTLALEGHYEGLLANPSSARLLMGSGPGVRGPKIADLAVSFSQSGTISGSVKLDDDQLTDFRKGGLYVEIDSPDAPEGDLWGWVMPPAE